MELEPLVYSARAAVAAAFLLSAGWKIRNQIEFRAVFRASAPRSLHRFARTSVHATAAVEILIATVLLTPGPLGQFAAGAAVVVTIFFSATLARVGNPALGCGCWRSAMQGGDPALHRKLLFVRNAVLASLAAVGALTALTFDMASLLFGLVAGSLLAIVVLEVPAIGVVATTERKARTSG